MSTSQETQKPPTISISISKYFNTATVSDLTLILRDRKIMAHKLILVCQSPYFENLLAASWAASEAREIELTHDEPDVLELTIKFFYEGSNVVDSIWEAYLPSDSAYNANRATLVVMAKDDAERSAIWTLMENLFLSADKYRLPGLKNQVVRTCIDHSRADEFRFLHFMKSVPDYLLEEHAFHLFSHIFDNHTFDDVLFLRQGLDGLAQRSQKLRSAFDQWNEAARRRERA